MRFRGKEIRFQGRDTVAMREDRRGKTSERRKRRSSFESFIDSVMINRIKR